MRMKACVAAFLVLAWGAMALGAPRERGAVGLGDSLEGGTGGEVDVIEMEAATEKLGETVEADSNNAEEKLDDDSYVALNPAKQLPPAVLTAIMNVLQNFGGEQKIYTAFQVVLYNMFALGVFYLFQTLIFGFAAFVSTLRSPLLIYKEVDGYKEVTPKPAPQYPAPHADYGYTGGFKTPKGEEVKYHAYYKPEKKKPEKPKKSHFKVKKPVLSSYSSYEN